MCEVCHACYHIVRGFGFGFECTGTAIDDDRYTIYCFCGFSVSGFSII